MSASVYGYPYYFKPPPQRIDYPSFFFGCKNCTFRYALDSKILALGVLVLGVATFVVMLMTLMPFWFELTLDPEQGTFGSEPVKTRLAINTGLFYMRESEFDNTVFLDKYTNPDTVPSYLQAAQVFSIAGTCLLVACFGGGVILLLKRFSSVTALIMLAGGTTLAAVCEILVIVCCAGLIVESSCNPYESNCNYHDNLEWNLIPIYAQMYRVEPNLTPYVQANWAFYIDIIAALITVGAAVLVWLEACATSRKLRQIRYQQLKEFRDPYEKEGDAYTGEKFRYQPPTSGGPNVYGMQPVVTAPHPYEGVVINPNPQPHGYIPPPSFHPRAPSSTSSFSGPPPTREIDL